MKPEDVKLIDEARAKFDAISDKARETIYRKVLEHYQKHPGSPWSGAPLRDLELMIKQFYSDMGLKYDKVFRETLPPIMQKYYDRAVEEMKSAGVRNAILGKPDTARVKYFLDSAFEQVAMKTQNMSFQHIRALRTITADVTRQMSITGATRRQVSKELLNRAMEIPGFAFIDKSGEKWQLKSYFNTLARTELMNAARASYDDKCSEEGFDVMKLTTSGKSCDHCSKYEGKLFSLTGTTKNLPTKQDLMDDGVFHPNCTHSYSLVPKYIAEKKYGLKTAMTSEEYSKTPMFGKKLIHADHSNADDAKATNPNYDPYRRTHDYNSNCQRCVCAYEARRRGYDVEALPIPLDAKGKPDTSDEVLNHWKTIFENAVWEPETQQDLKFSLYKFVADKVHSYGEGSRSIVYVKWKKEKYAHVFIAENHNGQVVYIDPQTGSMNCIDYLFKAERGRTQVCRIDNLEFSDYIKGCCKNRRL